MESKDEIVILTDSRSLFDVRGGSFDSILLVEGKPIALNWSDCEGSVAQYMVRAGVTNYEEQLQSLRYTLDGNFRSDLSISSQIDTFLQLFAPSRYRLRYYESCPDYRYIEFNTAWIASKDYAHFYPYNYTFVLTQPTDSLHEDRIAYYVERIQKGYRPVALTTMTDDGWCEFVLDGHHKLQAYKLAKIEPSIIQICRLDAPLLRSNSFDQYIGKDHPMSDHYHKVKNLYDH